MTLDIHELIDGCPKKLLYQLDDVSLQALTSAFARFESRTGLLIDPDGDLRLSSGLEPLISAISDSMAASEGQANELCNAFLRRVVAWQRGGINIIFVGD